MGALLFLIVAASISGVTSGIGAAAVVAGKSGGEGGAAGEVGREGGAGEGGGRQGIGAAAATIATLLVATGQGEVGQDTGDDKDGREMHGFHTLNLLDCQDGLGAFNWNQRSNLVKRGK